MVDVTISIRQDEGDDDQPFLLWDTVWNADERVLDWALCPIGNTIEPQNGGGLQSRRPLDTAIRLCFGCQRRAEAYDVLPDGNDPKGWWGDSIQLDGEYGNLGSRFWLLYRSVLNEETAQQAVLIATEALQPLLTQGAFASFDIVPTFSAQGGWLALQVLGYSQDGQKIYDQRFQRMWALEQAEMSPNTPVPTGF